MGSLKVIIETHEPESKFIPKQIQILGADLSVKHSLWIEDNLWMQELGAGVYLVRLNLASGKQIEKIAEVFDGEVAELEFNIAQFSPMESQEWAYLTKSSVGDNVVEYFRKDNRLPETIQIRSKRWRYYHQRWISENESPVEFSRINEYGQTSKIDVPREMQLMEVTPLEKQSTFICLPPENSLNFMIKKAVGPQETIDDINVSVGIANKVAQALLSLMNSGDMLKGKSLFTVKNAEQLLYNKISDPVGAAIGGYFLLKTRELDRMHNWPDNLADWFDWMPDGAVIHGWQLIQMGAKPDTIRIIRQRFLEAVKRGIPIYSEGLRLLYEGLTMLSNEFEQSDRDIEKALSTIKKYMAAADLSKENTTFRGSSPDLPELNSSVEKGVFV